MKNRLIVISFFLYPLFSLNAQENTIVVSSRIKDVTVFTSGAQVTRGGSVNLKAGNQQLVFENLPQDINAQSIQVSGTGDFTTSAVNNKINFL
jgi:hypothetical protein